MNTLEFHPWGARIDDPERPDRMVFDLDPGEGVRWPDMVAAARETRDRLRRAGLRSFVRLSGGKGLHVVVPLARGPSWDAVRAFCDAVTDAVAGHAPERYVVPLSKAERPGKGLIDWRRNARWATTVPAVSLPPPPGGA